MNTVLLTGAQPDEETGGGRVGDGEAAAARVGLRRRRWRRPGDGKIGAGDGEGVRRDDGAGL